MLARLLMSLTHSPSRLIDAPARQIADLCSAEVASLVADQTRQMTLCEIRGYIRARAARAVRRRVQICVADSVELRPYEGLLRRRAIDCLVPVVMRRLAAWESPAAAVLRKAA